MPRNAGNSGRPANTGILRENFIIHSPINAGILREPMITAQDAKELTEESKPFWDKYWNDLELKVKEQAKAGFSHLDISCPKKNGTTVRNALRQLGYKLTFDEINPHSPNYEARITWYCD